MDDLIWTSPHINAWIKDRNGRYLKCSESFAQYAGVDSPSAIIGMDDTQLVWRDGIQQIRRGDVMTFAGAPVTNAHYTLLTHAGLKSILLNKHAANDILVGSAIDITGKVLMTQNGRWDINKKVFTVNNIDLTVKEIDVIRLLLLGQSVKLIAARLSLHTKTIEQRIDILRKKFNVNSKVDLVHYLHQNGLEYLAHNIDKNINL